MKTEADKQRVAGQEAVRYEAIARALARQLREAGLAPVWDPDD